MPKINDLISFEKVKEVIDIDLIKDKKSMVEKYVISEALEDHLTGFFKDLSSSKHKSLQIIGGYGSGKSHLLAFIISLLQDKNLSESIQNQKVKNEFEKIKREFVVIHRELQPNDVDLSAYFYDNLETQLDENYGIKINVKLDGIVDHKRILLDILEKIKKDNPTRGLVVVIDEISDFLKQKSKEKINRDMQFLRILGQVSNESDFMFVGAMQEHIFSNPKYVDEAESFGKVSERFHLLTISREDIKKVISKRVLDKSTKQRLELDKHFSGYVKYFPTIQNNIEDYINMFPLHPYVIQIFSELPYFEKRGVIQFTIQEVEKILDKSFPEESCIITYDKIYDEMSGKHTVKHLENVSPIISAVGTLESKIDLLEKKHQSTARRIIKALAVLKLYGKSTNNGATLEELANTLLLLPNNKVMSAIDEISIVLKKLGEVSDGQFINKSKEGYYYLDLNVSIDFDQVIDKKTSNLPENAMDDEIIQILKEHLSLEEDKENGRFNDTCTWKETRSFREGSFIYENGKNAKNDVNKDYQIVFVSPLFHKCRYKPSENVVIITSKLSDEAIAKLKRLAAAKVLINDNYNRSVIEKKYINIKKEFIDLLMKSYLENGNVEFNDKKKSVKQIISREFKNFDELFSEIKPQALSDYFNKAYPNHPKFNCTITRDNISGEFSSALKLIFAKETTGALFSNSKSILNALGLIDETGNLSTVKSDVAQKILEKAKKSAGQNIDIKDIIDEFAAKPFGYDALMTQFILTIMTYNGEISMKVQGGKVVSSSDVENHFSNGISAFQALKYIALESEINLQPIINLFTIIGLNAAEVRNIGKRINAVQSFRSKYLEIKEIYDTITNKLNTISFSETGTIDIDGLKKKHEILSSIPFDDFEKVKAPSDFKKISYSDDVLKNVKAAFEMLQKLHYFYSEYSSRLQKEIEYTKEVNKIIEKHCDIFQIERIKDMITDSFKILSSADSLVDNSQLNPLFGKLQQIKKNYITAYYHSHENFVGNKVDWKSLLDTFESKNFYNLKILKNVSILNKSRLNKIESEMVAIKSLQCSGFNPDVLENKALCPRCNFPASTIEYGIKNKITAIEAEIEEIHKNFENTILTELNNYKDNLKYLSAPEKKLIEGIIKNSSLPEQIDEKLIIALNNLFSELESVTVNLDEMVQTIFSDSQLVDYPTFEKKINEFKQRLVAGKDLAKIRLKLGETS
ncbi:MAG: hypothetical protein GYA62_16975 [Bacteroidales bacterium]|nr:hypothetical protein [Bacteroidales bacterium]